MSNNNQRNKVVKFNQLWEVLDTVEEVWCYQGYVRAMKPAEQERFNQKEREIQQECRIENFEYCLDRALTCCKFDSYVSAVIYAFEALRRADGQIEKTAALGALGLAAEGCKFLTTAFMDKLGTDQPIPDCPSY